MHAVMPSSRDTNEEAKKQELYEKADNNDVGACTERFCRT